MEKIIKSVGPNGIKYINECGEESFVDFKKCNYGWMQYRNRIDGKNNLAVTSERYVGQRNVCADPSFIEFFTYPKFTRFEFKKNKHYLDSEFNFEKLKEGIVSCGWQTLDLS